VRHVVAWLVWWIVLWWLWLLLVGEWNRYAWIAASCAATAGATIGELARVRREIHARVPLRRLRHGWWALAQIFVDFGIVTWALVRSALQREVVRGVFRAHEFEAGGDDSASVGARTWATLLADFSPNAYVIEIECDRQLVLLHDLVPNRRSERPA